MWQPIETAPKDGTQILLGWFDPKAKHFKEVGFWREERGLWGGNHGNNFPARWQPTHWKPLDNDVPGGL